MDQRDLEFALDAAAKRLRSTAGKAAQGVENQYGLAYQQLVKAGIKPQIRHKYRVSKG